jgi:hypothetical protein
MHHDWSGLRTAAIYLTILAPLAAVRIRRRFIPLPLGNEITDFIIGQPNQQPLALAEYRSNRWFQRRGWKIDVRLDGLLKFAINQFGVKLTRDTGQG